MTQPRIHQLSLDLMSDVVITAPATIYDHLEYNGSTWVNTQTPTLPDDWTCPVCGASKGDFEKEE